MNIMSSSQNDDLFPLYRERLKILANSWVKDIGKEIPDIYVEDIALYSYSSHFAKVQSKHHPAKYCVVFGIKDEKLPEPDSNKIVSEIDETEVEKIPLRAWLESPPIKRPLSQSEKEEANDKQEKCKARIAEIKKAKLDNLNGLDYSHNLIKPMSIYSFLGCYQTIDRCCLLMEARFEDIYKYKVVDDQFRNEWIFLTRKLAEENSSVMLEERHWVLYDVKGAFHEPLNTTEIETEQKESENHKESNFFKRNDDFWTIRFEDKESRPIKHVDGLLYMAYLLERPGISISCKDLYQSVSGSTPVEAISEGAAIEQGLSIGNSKQEINDNDAKKSYWKKYNELQGDLQKVESDLERQEIEKEMNSIFQCLNKQNFVDPNAKKTQANITKRLNAAYDSIHDSGMKELANHLRDNIKTDGAYGRIYSGSINWKVLIG